MITDAFSHIDLQSKLMDWFLYYNNLFIKKLKSEPINQVSQSSQHLENSLHCLSLMLSLLELISFSDLDA